MAPTQFALRLLKGSTFSFEAEETTVFGLKENGQQWRRRRSFFFSSTADMKKLFYWKLLFWHRKRPRISPFWQFTTFASFDMRGIGFTCLGLGEDLSTLGKLPLTQEGCARCATTERSAKWRLCKVPQNSNGAVTRLASPRCSSLQRRAENGGIARATTTWDSKKCNRHIQISHWLQCCDKFDSVETCKKATFAPKNISEVSDYLQRPWVWAPTHVTWRVLKRERYARASPGESNIPKDVGIFSSQTHSQSFDLLCRIS